MKQSEHVLYITLIDFLLQLLFLGMVIGAIYAIAQQQTDAEQLDPAKAKEAIDAIEKIKKYSGISDLTDLTDEMTRLGPLKSAVSRAAAGKVLEASVASVGGLDEAAKLLDEHAKKTGQGTPSCLPNRAIVATLHAYEDRIEIKQMTDELKKLLTEANLAPAAVADLSRSAFPHTFNPVIALSGRKQCKYNVEVVEYSYDTRPRDAIRQVFSPVRYSHGSGR